MALQQRKVLYEQEYFTHYFLCRYIPKTKGSDRLSRSLLSFKAGHSPHQKAWTDCAVSELKKIRELEGTLIIRALTHTEQRVSDHEQQSIDYLGVKLAHAFSGTYQSDCLQKIKLVPKLVSLNKTERTAALYNAYRFTAPDRIPKRILIIDDILTSGATTQAIIHAVLKALPSIDITIFTLATTDYDTALNQDIELRARPYSWEPNQGWMMVAENTELYGEALATIKGYILNDTFQ